MKDDLKTKKQLIGELTALRLRNSGLEQSECTEKYRLLVESIRDVIYELDSQGVVLYISPAIKDLLGYDSAEVVGKSFIAFAHEDDRSNLTKWFSGLREGAESPSEHRVISKSGESRWARMKTRPIVEDGRFKGARGILIDVTEQKRAEEKLRESEELFRSYLEYAPDGVYMCDLEGNFIYGNRKCEEIIGYRREELIGKNMIERNLLPEKYLNKAVKLLHEDMEGKSTGPDEFELIGKEGRLIPVEISSSVVQSAAGQSIVLAFVREITDRKQAEEDLRMSEEQFRRIFDEGPFGMVLANPDYTIVMANKAFCRLLGYGEQELAGQNLIKLTYEEDQEKSKESSEHVFAGGVPVFRFEKRYIGKDGGIVWAHVTVAPIHGSDGDVLYTVAIIEDLTERRTAAEKIHLLNYYDSLTGLPNRIFHKELIKRSIAHSHRYQEIFALIYIGLDNFQRINETLGHGAGDILLKAVADRLTNALRKSDTIARSGEADTVNNVSRGGGDEFIVLAHDLGQSQDAVITARRLLAEMAAPYDLSGREVFITASIGISLYPDDGTNVDDLLKNAEKAMRHTKSEGKNNYHFYSGSMDSFVLELLTLENDLHRALERNELVLYYQPKVDTATRMVTGMEALIRWNHPDRGLIPPMQFIAMAETSGLILPIGAFVIRTVCRQIKTWQEAGCKQVCISLNVSGRQFDQQNLIEIVQEALQDAMISPQWLELEITESMLMRNPEKAVRILTALKALGIGISIDDFGTGYSSLSYLKRMPLLDFLKIDQSFIKSLASDSRDQAIVRATIAMAHSLNLKTIAEGVETEEQLSFLQEHGCDEIQGYLFSRPLPEEEIPGILAKGYL